MVHAQSGDLALTHVTIVERQKKVSPPAGIVRALYMQDVMGIVLLLGVALLPRFFVRPTAMVHVTVRVIPFNVIVSWVLLSLSLAWSAVACLGFVARVHSS